MTTQIGYPHYVNLAVAVPLTGRPSRVLSPEHKQKISATLKGRTFSEEHLAKLRANAESRKGIPLSPETRRKLSIAAKGRIYSPEVYEKTAAKNRGRKKNFKNPALRRQRLIAACTLPAEREARRIRALNQWKKRTADDLKLLSQKISRTLSGQAINDAQRRGLALGRLKNRGETHWNYKGGKGRTYPKEFRELRPLILERDGYTCVMCGSDQRNAVHHIDYNKHHNTWLNLVTLCHACNLKAESRANKDSWPIILRFYTESLMERVA